MILSTGSRFTDKGPEDFVCYTNATHSAGQRQNDSRGAVEWVESTVRFTRAGNEVLSP